jgi:hypothetical protein
MLVPWYDINKLPRKVKRLLRCICVWFNKSVIINVSPCHVSGLGSILGAYDNCEISELGLFCYLILWFISSILWLII